MGTRALPCPAQRGALPSHNTALDLGVALGGRSSGGRPLLPPKDPECLNLRCPGPAGIGCSAVRLGERDWL